MTYSIETRHRIEINTDPQRRCYNGVHARSEIVWTQWETIDFFIKSDRIEERLEFWRSLNDYAIKERGESARREFIAV